MNRELFRILVLCLLAGCSSISDHTRCVIGYSTAGAGIAELGLVVGAMTSACNGDCMQRKIELGETVSQAVHHSLRQRDDIITYVSFAAVPVGALAGFGVGEYMCGENGLYATASKNSSAKIDQPFTGPEINELH
jgi:uncharacterized protein YceK